MGKYDTVIELERLERAAKAKIWHTAAMSVVDMTQRGMSVAEIYDNFKLRGDALMSSDEETP